MSNHSRYEKVYGQQIGRRDLLRKLSGIAVSFAGLTAFRRLAPLDGATRDAPRAPKWDDRYELAVDLELAPQMGARSHRPYVAVWVEDANGNPVRTLCLWVNTTGRGPRYIQELRQWFSVRRTTESGGGPDLVSTVSSATRLPGQYTVTWNGKDDRGNAVEQGTYRVFIEAAREHGTYQLMKQELALATTPVAADLTGNVEIGKAHVEFRRRK